MHLTRQHRVILLVLTFIVSVAFLLLSDLNQQPQAKLDRLIDGTAQRPYVSRRLVPQLLGILTADLPEPFLSWSVAINQHELVNGLLWWLAIPIDYGLVLLVFSILNFLFLLGFAVAFHRLASILAVPQPFRWTVVSLLLLLLPVFLSHGYVYDYSTLFLWTLFFLMLAEKRWGWSFAVIGLAALNKETALLIPLVWLTYGRLFGRSALYWPVLAAQSILVAFVWAMIAWAYRDNPGGFFEFHFSTHWTTYLAAPGAILTALIGIIVVIYLAYPLAPRLLRSSSVLLIPLTILYLFFGWPYEFRVFYEIYPIVVLFAALAIQRLVRHQVAAAPKNVEKIPDERIAMGRDAFIVPQNRRIIVFHSSQRVVLMGILLLAFGLRVWQLDVHPPGLLLAEALNGLTAQSIAAGKLALLLPSSFDWAPGFVLLQAIAVDLLDMSAYSLRIVSAMLGTLTLAVVFSLARKLFVALLHPVRDNCTASANENTLWWANTLAVVSTAVIAVSFLHLGLSRLGLDAILLPGLTSLTIFFFWQAWAGRGIKVWLLAGFWGGITLYAGTTALVFPLVLILFVGSELLLQADWLHQPVVRRQRMVGLGLMTLCTILVSLPLLLPGTLSPSRLAGDLAETSVFTAPYAEMPGSPRERLGQNLDRLVSAFYFTGDGNLIHNLPGRPLHDPILAVFFTCGLALVVWRTKDSIYRLIGIWFVVMILPTLLTVNAPNFRLMAGVAPPLALLYAIGLLALLKLLPWRHTTTAIVVVAVLFVTGASTIYDYFVQWPHTDGIDQAFDTNSYSVAQKARKLIQEDSTSQILLSERLVQSPAFRILIDVASDKLEDDDSQSNTVPVTRTVQLGEGVFFLEENLTFEDDLFLLESEQGTWTMQRYALANRSDQLSLASTIEQAAPSNSQGDQLQIAGVLTGVVPYLELVPATIHNPLHIQFDNGLELLGYRQVLSPTFCTTTKTSVPLVTYWRKIPSEQVTIRTARAFAHLMLPDRQVQANGELNSGYPAALWRPGEIIKDTREFSVPAGGQGGKAFIEMGLYVRALNGDYRRQQIGDSSSDLSADQIEFSSSFFCADVPDVSTTGFKPLNVQFEGRIELVGLNLDTSLVGDQQMNLQIIWRSLDRMHTNYTAFAHLIDEQDQIVSQSDQPPGGGDNPTRLWVPGEMTLSNSELELSPSTSVDQLRLRIGLYEPASGRQLTISSPPNLHGASYVILTDIAQLSQ